MALMAEEIEQLQNRLFAIVEKEIDAGHRDKAIEVAIACYFLSKGFGPALEDGAMTQIYAAFLSFLRRDAEEAQARCSFCGRSGERVRLGAGPDAYICEECVGTFAERFKKGESADDSK